MEPNGSLPHSKMPTTYPCPEPERHNPCPHILKDVLILSSHLCLGLPSCPFPSYLPTETLCTPLPTIRATCPAHLFLLDLVTRTILDEEYLSFSSLLCFLHSPVNTSLFGPNILLNTLFSNNLGLRSSLNVNNKVSQTI